jgi:hypothetical protein
VRNTQKYLLVVKIGLETRQFSFKSILSVQKFMMGRGYLTKEEKKAPPPKGKSDYAFEVQLYQIVGKLA